MYARVARFEGADAETLKQTATRINSDADSGPPEGVPAKGLILLIDPVTGGSLGITLFENEDDYRKGDENMNEMSPPVDGGMGRRVSVDKYEVAVKVEV
ncbi:MAG: hypothetical protein WB507_09650 [Solirubrobacterales bacterium]